MNVKGFYTGLAHQIEKETIQEQSAIQRKDALLTVWEFKDKTANPRISERGEAAAANLRGTPAWCMKGASLMDDLEWLISKL